MSDLSSSEALRKLLLAVALVVASSVASGGTSAGERNWRAIGHEPSWAVTRADGTLVFETDFGASRHEFPLPEAKRLDEQTVRYSTSAGGLFLDLIVKEGVCIDTMTGMPRPEQVTVQIGERKLSGCGGDPEGLLQRHEWKVTHLAGKAVLAEPVISVTFSGDGRVSGLASCNRFGAGYAVTGEGLKIEKGFSSMMACEPPVMQQEQTFLKLLERVTRFSVTEAGELALHTQGEETIELAKL